MGSGCCPAILHCPSLLSRMTNSCFLFSMYLELSSQPHLVDNFSSHLYQKRHPTNSVLQVPLSFTFSSLSSLENSHQGKCCNTVNLKDNTKQTLLLTPSILLSNYSISLYPFTAKLPLTELTVFAASNFSLVPISVILLSPTLQLNTMSRSLKSTKLLEGDSQMKYYLAL